MGDVTTQLQLGAQTKGAGTVVHGVPAIQTALKTAATGIQGEAAGFAGGAASSFYKAVKAWFDAGADIPTGLTTYADKLVQTDASVATSQAATAQAYLNAQSRLAPVPR